LTPLVSARLDEENDRMLTLPARRGPACGRAWNHSILGYQWLV